MKSAPAARTNIDGAAVDHFASSAKALIVVSAIGQ
jgi:hypothetical protein